MGVTRYKGRDIPNRAFKSNNRNVQRTTGIAGSVTGDNLRTTQLFLIDAETVAITNVSLSGLFTISGYLIEEGDVILVNNNTLAYENGLYIASNGTWSRISQDPNYIYRVLIREGVYKNTEWRFDEPYKRIDIDDINFTQVKGSGSILDTSIILNSTQIKNINAAPIPFLSAQGANTVIDPISCIATLNWNTSAYVALGTPPNFLYLSFETSPGIYSDIFKVSDALITASGADLTVKLEDNDGLSFNQLVSNSPLIIRGDSDYITGNSTITLQLLYRVLEV